MRAREKDVPPTDEAELIERISERDQEALKDLYERYGGLLLALARRILNDANDAEEVLQEVFLQVWNQAGRYDHRRSSVSTWLVLITRSRSIDRLRSRQVDERTLANLESENRDQHTSPVGVTSVWTNQRRDRLRRELQLLPPEQKRVLDLAFYRGMTQSEIAEATGIPLGTVKTRTLLAMRKLREALQDEVRDLL